MNRAVPIAREGICLRLMLGRPMQFLLKRRSPVIHPLGFRGCNAEHASEQLYGTSMAEHMLLTASGVPFEVPLLVP